MKHLATIFLLSMFSSSAMSYCPARLDAGRKAATLATNYDRTCTILDPQLVHLGEEKFVGGDLNAVCEAFGFGANSGVDGIEGRTLNRAKLLVVGDLATNRFFVSITCRMDPSRIVPQSPILE